MLTRSNNQKYAVLTIIALFVLALAVYSNTFFNSFHFDDTPFIVDNPAIRNIGNLRAIWLLGPTRFITYTSVALNYATGKREVFGYHLFNFFIHLGSAMLVWWLAMLTFSTPLVKKERISMFMFPVAFFTGVVFLVHPLQTQPVNYIIQRSCLLATFFYIASLGFYVKAMMRKDEGSSSSSWKLYYACSLVMATAGIFCKETVVSLPLAVCLYELYFLRIKKDFRWKYIAPFFIIILGMLLVMLLSKTIDFKKIGWVVQKDSDISAFTYFLTQLKVEVTYLRLLFVPLNQNLDYDYPIARSIFEIPVVLSFLLLLLVAFFGVRLFNRYKLASFGIFWFFITLLPESSRYLD